VADYTRLIEFKVKDTDLNRAVNKLTKTLTRIDKTLVGIDKKIDHIAKEGFGSVAKEANRAEKSVSKLGKSLKNLASPQGLASGALGLLTGNIGGTKGEIARRVSELTAFDQILRKVTKGNTGLPAFSKRVTEAATALTGFGIAHWGAITGIAAGGAAIIKGTQFFYNLGKGVRQAEANLIDFLKTSKQVGLGKNLRSLLPSFKPAPGSRLGGADDGGPNIGMPPSSPIGIGSSRGLEAVRPKLIQSQIGGLTKLNNALKKNEEIQDNINASIKGPYLQAVKTVKQAQFAYNLELQKAKVIQAAVNADIWAAQKAWQGVVSTLKGATGLVGKVFGGILKTDAGKGAGIIALTRSIEALTGKLGFLNQAWLKNINTVASWSARASEAITAVSLGYSGLSTVLSAANWVVGATKGFVEFERKAVEVFHNISAARRRWERDSGEFQQNTLLQNMFGPLSQMLRGRMGNKLKEIYGGKDAGFDEGGAFRGMSDRTPYGERLTNELEAARQKLSELRSTNDDFAKQVSRVLTLEARVNDELAKQQKIKEETLAVQNKLKSMDERDRDPNRKIKEHQDQIKKGDDARKKEVKEINALERQEMRQRNAEQQAAANNYEKQVKKRLREERRETNKIENERLRKQKERQRQRKDAMGRFGENLMLGAGFPMLFGGGAGAVAGGVTGAITQSALGSRGFGAQILFSAVGQQVDAFAAKAVELGKALQDPAEALSALSEMGIEVDKSLKNQVETMVKAGKAYDAQILVSKEVAKVIGRDGVMALKNLGIANKELTTKANKLRIKIMSDLAPAFMVLIDLADRFIDSVAGQQTRSKAQEIAIKSGRGDLWTAAEKKATQAAMEVNPKSGLLDSLFEKVLGVTATDVTKGPTAEKYFEVLNQESKKILQQLAPGYLGIEGITSKAMGEGTEPGTGIDDKAGKLLEAQRISGLDTKDLQAKVGLEKKRLSMSSTAFEIKTRELELNRQNLEIQYQESELENTKDVATQKVLRAKINQLKATRDLNAAEFENFKTLNLLDGKWQQIASTIENGVVNAIEGAIQGTKTLGEVASSVFNQIARQMLQMSVNAALSGMFPNLFPARAAGGPVSGGSPYIVGEKGPELFVPGSSGNIVPNHELGGSGTNIVVNVDASGSSVEGNEAQSRELGNMLAGAIQTELVRQKRPGGLLA